MTKDERHLVSIAMQTLKLVFEELEKVRANTTYQVQAKHHMADLETEAIILDDATSNLLKCIESLEDVLKK